MPARCSRSFWPSAALAAGFALSAAGPAGAQRGVPPGPEEAPRPLVTPATLQAALDLIGLRYDDSALALLLQPRGRFGNDFSGRGDRRLAYDSIRAVPLDNADPPALFFEPLPPAAPVTNRPARFAPAPARLRRPADLEEAAFWPVTDLAALVRTRQVTSVELTRMFLDRLRRFDPRLHAVVTLTDSLAMEQARRADREIAAGHYRGPLHGIPYGVKDLYAVPGYPTTWGAAPFRDQVIDTTATAVRRLEQAGAVLVAKLTSGALAMGDVWFGGRTRNPWNTDEGSSGSSAGPAAAVSAGLVPFALGTETLGSIVSPATRTGVTGLRPSFGRVSRAGVMALSWSMDKAGPLCRNAGDCALILDAIRGGDPADPAAVDVPFPYEARADISRLRIGYLRSAFETDHRGADLDRRVLDVLRGLGARLVPIELPARPAQALRIILSAEAAAAFDDLTRSRRDSLLVRQDAGAWPNQFRSARFIPAVEYLRASRVRRLLQRDMQRLLADIDVYVSPAFAGGNLLVTNLTGHPCVAVPDGFLDTGDPASITFCGRMYGEAEALEVARAYQEATPWDERHPQPFGGNTPVTASRERTDSTAPRLYVPNQSGPSISVLDGAGTVLTTIDLRALGFTAHAMPHQVAAAPDGSAWYVTLAGDGYVLKFDRDNRLVAKAPLALPGMIVLDPRRDRLYVSRALMAVHPPSSLGVLRASDLTLVDEPDILISRPHALAVDTVTGRVYAGSLDANQIATLETEGRVSVTTLPGPPHGFVGLATSPDGRRLVATTQITNQLLAFETADPRTLGQIAAVPVAPGPYDVAYSPDGLSVWVPDQRADCATQVDTRTWTVAAVVRGDGFAEPHGVAVTPDSRTVYITNHGRLLAESAAPGVPSGPDAPRANGTVVVIDAPTHAIRTVAEVGPFAAAPGLGGIR